MVGQVGRLFLAVDLPSEAKQALAARLEDEVPGSMPGKLVPPTNWHLTLRFLGEVDSVKYDRLLMELSDVDLGRRFEVTFDGLGAFPREKSAAVVWVGVGDGAALLEQLARVVEGATCSAGFSPEERPFRGHLTLSRIRPPRDVDRLVAATRKVKVRSGVDAVTLFRSHWRSGGTSYEAMEKFELR